MEEEIKIQEAEIERVQDENDATNKESVPDTIDEGTVSDKIDEEKKRRMDVYVEFALIFILGILIGIAVKTEAVKRITMGFDDYKMKIFSQDYDISKLQAESVRESAEEQSDVQEQAE